MCRQVFRRMASRTAPASRGFGRAPPVAAPAAGAPAARSRPAIRTGPRWVALQPREQQPGHRLAVPPFYFRALGRARVRQQRLGGDGRAVGGFLGGLFRCCGWQAPDRRIIGGEQCHHLGLVGAQLGQQVRRQPCRGSQPQRRAVRLRRPTMPPQLAEQVGRDVHRTTSSPWNTESAFPAFQPSSVRGLAERWPSSSAFPRVPASVPGTLGMERPNLDRTVGASVRGDEAYA